MAEHIGHTEGTDSETVVQDLYNQLDKNGDGCINEEEFIHALAQNPERWKVSRAALPAQTHDARARTLF